MERLRALLVCLLAVACASVDVDPVSPTVPPTATPGSSPPPEAVASVDDGDHLVGRVVDPDGRPVEGAVVEISGSSTRSAADGWFDIGPVHAGVVTASRPGWVAAEVVWNGGSSLVEMTIEPRRIRGLRVSAHAAGDSSAYQDLLELADATAVDAFVFDSKQEGGVVLYDTTVEEAHQIGAVNPVYDPAELLALARGHGLYTVTRIVTFEDDLRVRGFPAEKLAGRWVDPTNEEAWEYPLALGVEACRLGFDEVQFDYVRFPSGLTSGISGQLQLSQEERTAAIEGFLAEARRRIHAAGCAVSADVFGIVVSAVDDQGIGQYTEELSRHVDILSPMVYPSHYSDGWLGYAEPNDHPYDVTADAIDDALERVAPGTIVRPWLQAFWWTSDQIRRSIQAAEDREVGWILWNAVSRYPRSAIPTDEELASP